MTRGKLARVGRLEGKRRARVAGPLSSPDAPRWEDLQGKTAAELEDVARRVGLPVEDLAGRSAADLTRLYFGGWPA